MRAHLFQYDIAWEDPEANYAKVTALAEAAGVGVGGAGAGDLIVLPEMFDTGFSFNIERTADAKGRSAAFLADLARRSGATVIGGVTAVGPDGRGRNRALVFGPDGREIARYDKLHPFSYGRESERFSGGERVSIFSWGGVEGGGGGCVVCPAVCYDLRFPELFRAGLGMGAQLFAIGANWPAARAAHWRALLVARAIENQAYVLGVNRCGADPHLSYAGGSIAVSPQGEIVADAGNAEGAIAAPIDIDALLAWRKTFPAWRDGRPELAAPVAPDGRLSGVRSHGSL